MKYYLFLDESGDHGLSNINPDFPIFLLCGVLFSHDNYMAFDASMNHIKQRFWNTNNVVLHSRDIRKHQNEFKILFDLEVKRLFYDEIDKLISDNEYVIIADGIQKNDFIKLYGKLPNVYELSLSFIIERAVFYLDNIGGDKNLVVVIEERGKKEDRQLKEHFFKLLALGTGFVNPERLKSLDISIEFRAKNKNINGLQLSDLVAYPIARYVLDSQRANPAFDVLKPKIYSKNGKLYGLKTFP